MNNKKGGMKQILALFMVVVVVFTSIQFMPKRAEAKVPTETTYEGDGFEVNFRITSSWKGAFNADVTIKNTRDSIIDNWVIGFAMPYEITNIWNGVVKSNEDGRYVIKNTGSNQDIAIGNSVNFGFSAKCDGDICLPNAFDLLGIEEEVTTEQVEISFKVTNDWEQAFNGEIKVKNVSEETIEDWKLEFEFDHEIDRFWSADIVKKEENRYFIKNTGYNSNIKPGETITLGFSASPGEVTTEPNNYRISQIICKNNDIITVDETKLIKVNDKYQLGDGFEEFEGSLENPDKVTKFGVEVYDKNNILIYSKPIMPEANWKTEDIGLINGNNKVLFTAITDQGRKATKSLIVETQTSKFMENLDLDKNDDDNDGLWNYFESYFGTDKDNPDTDGDGLNDFVEVYTFNYNPLAVDSDGNGISDYDEDCDEDSITNGEEVQMGSHPLKKDTDGEGLNDAEELTYGTDLNKEDTDEDGISDYEEYILGTDMLTPNNSNGEFKKEFSCTDYDITMEQGVYPSIELTADAKGILKFKMEEVSNNPLINYSMVGYLGSAYNFTTEGEIKEATLTFTINPQFIDESMLNSPDFSPTIYYYDEENQTIVEVENQVRKGNQVSAKLNHFSTYLLINKADLEELWNRTLDIPGEENLYERNQVVFVLDTSPSMEWNDPNYIRAVLTKQFVEKMGKDDEVAVLGFDSYVTKYTTLTSDKVKINNAIEKFIAHVSPGGTLVYKGLIEAGNIFNNTADSSKVQKCIFLLTDGEAQDTPTTEFLNELKQKGIKVYAIGLGSASEPYLTRIAETTGGKYYYAKEDTDLNEVFLDFENNIKGKDDNNDGIADYYTYLMCTGDITTITGTRIFYEEDYEEIQSNSDFDEDGLKNGEEVSIYYMNGKPYAKVATSPIYFDTDFDGYSDYEEVKEYFSSSYGDTMVINAYDYLYLNTREEYQSFIASDAYVKGNVVVSSAERFFDVLLCGGEISLKTIARKDLTDYLVDYTEENYNELYVTAYIDMVNDIIAGYSDILGLSKSKIIETKKSQLTKEINEVSKIVKKCRRSVKYMGHHLDEFRSSYDTMIKLQKDFKEIETVVDTDIKKIGNKATRVGLALSFISCTMENLSDTATYFSSLNVLDSYRDILTELKNCDFDEIETAAETIIGDLDDVYEKWNTVWVEYRNDIFSTGATSAISSIVGGIGIPGLIIDLTSLAGGIVLGDSLSTRLRNSVSVNIATCISQITDKYISKGQYKADAYGGVNILVQGETSVKKAQRMLAYMISSTSYCEQKYVEYLNDSSTFFDADIFLYKSAESERLAKENIIKLEDLLANFALK